jgi:uncharacterized protein (DUF2062 family)
VCYTYINARSFLDRSWIFSVRRGSVRAVARDAIIGQGRISLWRRHAPQFRRSRALPRENPLFHRGANLDNFSDMNPIRWLRDKSRQLLQLKDTSHAIALGTAVGMFFGFIPLWGFKTLLALGLSRLLRGNLLATAIATTLHDIALPLMPLLLRWEYEIGYWILSHPHELPPSLRLSHHSASVWFHWSTFLTLGRPLLLGSLVFATPVAIATYYITLAVIQRSRTKDNHGHRGEPPVIQPEPPKSD